MPGLQTQPVVGNGIMLQSVEYLLEIPILAEGRDFSSADAVFLFIAPAENYFGEGAKAINTFLATGAMMENRTLFSHVFITQYQTPVFGGMARPVLKDKTDYKVMINGKSVF